MSNQIAGATNAIMRVSLVPDAFLRDALSFVITLSGMGLSCTNGCPVAFLSPIGSGVTASATISGTQVVTVTLSSTQTFAASESVSFQISNVTNPTASQPELRNVRAVVLSISSDVIASSDFGVLSPYFKGTLSNTSLVLSDAAVGVNSTSFHAQWDFSEFTIHTSSIEPSPVLLSFSFSPSTVIPVRTVSVIGVTFSHYAHSASFSNCSTANNTVSASVSWKETFQSITISLSNDINVTGTSSVVSCFVGFFFNSQTRKTGQFAAISTFNWLNQPIDINPRVPFSDIFLGKLHNASISLSSVVASDKSVLSISFYPSSVQYPVKTVSLSGVSFSQFVAESVVCYVHSVMVDRNVSCSSSPQSLSIAFLQSIPITVYGPVHCKIAGFLNPSSPSTTRDVVIATYDANLLPIDVGKSNFPAIFASQSLLAEVSLGTHAESSTTTVTVIFLVPQTSPSIGTVSIHLNSFLFAGVRDGKTACSNMNQSAATSFSGNRIVIAFNGTMELLNSSAPIQCQIAGVIISPYSGSNQESFTLESFDSNSSPLTFASGRTLGVTCKSGFFAINGACQQCLAGTYCVSNCSISSPCSVCPAGFYSIEASVACLPCPAGSFAAMTGKSVCDVCSPGSTSSTGSSSCVSSSAFYTAASWISSNPKVLLDLSLNHNHILDITGGNITVVSPADESPYLSGSSSTKLKFPATMISDNFTLIYVARFEGSTQRGIFQSCSSPSWVSAFHQGKSGVSVRPGCGLITENLNLHGSDWVVVTEQSSSVRTNGVHRTKSNISNCSYLQDSLCINVDEAQSSDFAIHTFMWFNTTLSIDQIMAVEALLMTQPRIWTPNRMQVKKNQKIRLQQTMSQYHRMH
jgi:hypothetical protein